MNRQVRLRLTVGAFLAVGLIGTSGWGHWCSNIYDTYARLVVKAERTTLNIATGQSGTLKVYVRNNFPYTLEYFKLTAQGNGLTVSVSPWEVKPFYPGMNATYTLTIENNSADASADPLKLLTLGASTKVGNVGFNTNWWNMSPTADDFKGRETQSSALNEYQKFLLNIGDGLGVLKTTIANLRTSGDYSSTAGANNFRALHQLGVLLRFKLQGSQRSDVVSAVTGLISNGQSDLAKGFAAFVAAYGGNDAGVKAAIEAQVNASGDLGAMAKAALLLLGESTHQAAVQTCASSASADAKALCQAALAIMGEDTYANQLKGTVGGSIDSASKIFYMNVFQLAVLARRGGTDGNEAVSFLSEDSPGPDADSSGSGCGCDTSGADAIAMSALILLLWAFRRHGRLGSAGRSPPVPPRNRSV